MMTTKTRLQDSSVVVTLPANNGEKVEPNKEYVVVYSGDGTITLVPKIDDPFTGGSIGELYEEDEWGEYRIEGREEF
ncbi:type II toxin-antitoxin system PemI/MazE family antitoxin [Enterococcus plantarum]|uniref:type II toxin-antitoxin system PemI/MazE family antitoxin n=1 Tax=Enterococcus plantarum TaxID=1077675 RepID=UPI001A9096C3|nr:AbrB family transcriptional regulator [Enterococcus plantarum]MBO0423878.1 AbrB family transcriptional regulator [Enterococcus plantarum]